MEFASGVSAWAWLVICTDVPRCPCNFFPAACLNKHFWYHVPRFRFRSRTFLQDFHLQSREEGLPFQSFCRWHCSLRYESVATSTWDEMLSMLQPCERFIMYRNRL
jgi:hypothetical protein